MPRQHAAVCRQYGTELDVYLWGSNQSPPPPTRREVTREQWTSVPWHASDYDGLRGTTVQAHLRGGRNAPAATFPQRHSDRKVAPAPESPIALVGVRLVHWGGRSTAVPVTAVRTAQPGSPVRTHQLQVFLYDQRAWQQLAEADMDAMESKDCNGKEKGIPASCSPPPLRLALRPRANPCVRVHGWNPDPAAEPAPAADAAEAEQAVQAGAGRPAAPCWLHRAASYVAAGAVRHTATGRHIQHIASCVAALHALYGSSRPPVNASSEGFRTTCQAQSHPGALRGRAGVAAGCLLLSLALQLLAGPVAALAVWRRREWLVGAAERGAAKAAQLLEGQYDWLMTATPAGVKLHAELCVLLGLAAHGVLRLARAAARWAWPRCAAAVVGLGVAASAAGGLAGGLALLHDLLLVVAGPLTLQAVASSLLLRWHLAWLAHAWALMRGTASRQRRGPRQRQTDPQEGPQPEPRAGARAPSQAQGSVGRASHSAQHHTSPPPLPTTTTTTTQEQQQQRPNERVQAWGKHSRRRGLRQQQHSTGSRSCAAPDAPPGTPPHPQPEAEQNAEPRAPSPSVRMSWPLASAAGSPRRSSLSGLGSRVPISRLESLLGLAPDPRSRDEVVVEQVIVGVLLLVPLVALLPTVTIWHCLALAAGGVPAALRCGLHAAAGVLLDNPLVALAWRGWRPMVFAGPAVMVECVHVSSEPAAGTSHGGVSCVDGTSSTHYHKELWSGDSDVDAAYFVVKPLVTAWNDVAAACLRRGVLGGWGAPPLACLAIGQHEREDWLRGVNSLWPSSVRKQ